MHHIDVYIARTPHQLEIFWVFRNEFIDILGVVAAHIEYIRWPVTSVLCAWCPVPVSFIDHEQRMVKIR